MTQLKNSAVQFVDDLRSALVSTTDQAEMEAEADTLLKKFLDGPEFPHRGSASAALALLTNTKNRLTALQHLRPAEQQVRNSVIAKIETAMGKCK